MSKSSSSGAVKNTSLPGTSAWARGPPNPAATSRPPLPVFATAPAGTPTPSAPSTRPATPSNHTRKPSNFDGSSVSHSRRPSMASHARKQSTLAGDAAVTIPKSISRAGNTSVTFGSIGGDGATPSSSPSPAPSAAAARESKASSVRQDVVKSFGTVPADTNTDGKASISAVNSSAARPPFSSTSSQSTALPATKPKFDVKKLFQQSTMSSPSSGPPPSSSNDQPSRGQSSSSRSQGPQHQNGGPNTGSVGPSAPRSPVQGRHSNNRGNGPMPSPRLAPQSHQQHPTPGMPAPGMGMMPTQGMPPPQAMGSYPAWGYYYDPYQAAAAAGWWNQYQQPMPPGMGVPHMPGQQPPMPMSPRVSAAQPPGTPTTSHASVAHPPSQLSNNINGMTSPPGTPATGPVPISGMSYQSNASPFTTQTGSSYAPNQNAPPFQPQGAHGQGGPGQYGPPNGTAYPPQNGTAGPGFTPGGGGAPSFGTSPSGGRLNQNASTFVPNRPGKISISIKRPDGEEVNISNIAKHSTPSSSNASLPTDSPASRPASLKSTPNVTGASARRVRMESEEDKRKRLQKEEAEKQAAKEKEVAERERLRLEEEEKVKKEERRLRLEAEKKQEEERLRKEVEEQKKREEEARIQREKAEQEVKEKAERDAKEKAELEAKEKAELVAKEKAELEAKEKAEREAKERAEREAKERAEQEAKEQTEREAKEKEEQERAARERPETEEAQGIEFPQTDEPEPMDSPTGLKSPDGEESDGLTSLKEKRKVGLRVDTSHSPQSGYQSKRPGPLDLTIAKGHVEAPLQSALATARAIEDLTAVAYPEGIKSPDVELNVNATHGKFRYDREFLIQFMEICKDRPENMPELHSIGLDPTDQPPQNFSMTRGGSGRRLMSGAPTHLGRQASAGFPGPLGGAAGFRADSIRGDTRTFSMGNFQAPKLSSQDRFEMANRTVSQSGGQFTRPNQMVRTTSQGGMGNKRTRSKRGEARSEAPRAHDPRSSYPAPLQQLQPENFTPLRQAENRWDRRVLAIVDTSSPELVDRKVKGLLNKLTMEKFDSISDQIIAWANKSETEKDGRTLIQVIRLVFEKATDEAAWGEMYARLCRKMMERISANVQDVGIKNTEGKPIAGGQLFRKYLLNRCQEDFERGWVNKEITAAAAAASKAAESGQKADGVDIELYSDEYYAAQKAKRQGLGLIRFIGELFKLQMLTERIMHECVKKLLGNVDNPEEEEIESLCKLLITVGRLLDVPKAKSHMDIYFTRMTELTKSPNVSSRMQFMLQDVLELRHRNWMARNQVAAPATLAHIHEQAAKESAIQQKESLQRQTNISMSRTGSRRGGERGGEAGPDGWTMTSRAPAKAGDLSHFGKISKSDKPAVFAPTSVFSKKKEDGAANKRESLSRTNSNVNMFHALMGSDGAEMEKLPERKRPGRKASVDSVASSGTAHRPKLHLQPRSKPMPDESPAETSSNKADSDAHSSDDEAEEGEIKEDDSKVAFMTETDAKRRVEEDLKEFFAIRKLDEADEYFSVLPPKFHHILIDKLVSHAIESREADARLVADLFVRAQEKGLVKSKDLEEGFKPIVELLEDLAIDAPRAYDLMAIMMKGAALHEDANQRIASMCPDGKDKLLGLLSS